MNKYAILKLKDLKVIKFRSKDELLDAIIALRKGNSPFAIFKYHPSAYRWGHMEVLED